MSLRLTPKSSENSLGGIKTMADGRSVLMARVRAAPESGRANEALVRLLASELGIAASAVTLERGQTGRVKQFTIRGDPARLGARLAELAAGPA